MAATSPPQTQAARRRLKEQTPIQGHRGFLGSEKPIVRRGSLMNLIPAIPSDLPISAEAGHGRRRPLCPPTGNLPLPARSAPTPCSCPSAGRTAAIPGASRAHQLGLPQVEPQAAVGRDQRRIEGPGEILRSPSRRRPSVRTAATHLSRDISGCLSLDVVQDRWGRPVRLREWPEGSGRSDGGTSVEWYVS
jgi:hypothetical protein